VAKLDNTRRCHKLENWTHEGIE